MRFLIGIDGGGTTTRGVISNLQGSILADKIVGPSNYQVQGVDPATDEIKSLVLDLIREAHADPNSIDKIVAGLAGLGRAQDKQRLKTNFEKKLPPQLVNSLHLTTDLHIALFGALKDEVGLIINAGTGAVAMGRDENGDIKRTDGWGYLLGDEGSGYWIGLQALKRSLKFYDGRATHTTLKERLVKYFSIDKFDEIIPLIYDKSENSLTKTVAGLTPLVFREARRNDDVAKEIVSEAGVKLGETASAVIERLDSSCSAIKVVLMGGVFSSSAKQLLLDGFEGKVTKSTVDWTYMEPKHPPKIGALLLASYLLGKGFFDPQ